MTIVESPGASSAGASHCESKTGLWRAATEQLPMRNYSLAAKPTLGVCAYTKVRICYIFCKNRREKFTNSTVGDFLTSMRSRVIVHPFYR
jgi:hypothetical protein